MCGSCSMSPLSGKQIKNKLKYLLDCCWASVIKSTERRKDVFFFFGTNEDNKKGKNKPTQNIL